MRSAVVAAVVVLAAACGEPEIDVELPARSSAQHVADLAGVLDAAALESQLSDMAGSGLDVVALTYETEQASCGEAYRAARRFVDEWEADVALVAVARPGDFSSDDADRQRCLGVQPRDDRAIPADVRETIAEELVPPLAGRNDWDGAFSVAAETLTRR